MWAFRQLGKKYGVDLYQRVLCSVFCTVNEPRKPSSQHLLVLPTALGENMVWYLSSATSPVGSGGNLAAISQRSFRQLWKNYGVKRRQRDLGSGFMTVGNADTIWHSQFFGAITFQIPAFDLRRCHS